MNVNLFVLIGLLIGSMVGSLIVGSLIVVVLDECVSRTLRPRLQVVDLDAHGCPRRGVGRGGNGV